MQVLITGANRGIGAALAGEALAAGHQVIGTARNIAGLGAEIEWVALDVTAPESVAAFAGIMAGRPLDVLVCNAGIYPDKSCRSPAEFTRDIWETALATNVTGVWLSLQAVLDNLLATKGKIAIISSAMASSARAPGGAYAYRASKAAATNLARNLAADLQSAGVAVGSYHPGWVRTDMGGDSADISVAQSASGLWARIEALSLGTTGVFEDYKGDRLDF